MSPKECTYFVRLRCPSCKRAGTAHIHEVEPVAYGEPILTVETLSTGFVIVKEPSKLGKTLDIHCAAHKLSAVWSGGSEDV
jgi:hypothetical protein